MRSLINFIKSIPLYIKFLLVVSWYQIEGLLQWILPLKLYAKNVDEDIVLITGAGSGLGRAIALEYARLKSSLVLWDINEKALEETKKLVELEYEKLKIANKCSKNKVCLTYYADVSDRDQVYKLAQKVYEDLNSDRASGETERYVSVLVNNAGIYHLLPLLDLKDEQIERIFRINTLSHFWTARAFLPNMMKHEKGHIVEIASMCGLLGLHKHVDYCASKFAIVGFEESLSVELDYLGFGDKIHTTVVCPSLFNSNLFVDFDSGAHDIMKPEFVAKEAVMAMRCNHSRVLIPKLRVYLQYFTKFFLTRKSIIESIKVTAIAKLLEGLKGREAIQGDPSRG